MIDTYILLSIMMMMPFLIKTVILRIWPELDGGVWVNILFTAMFIIGLIVLIGTLYQLENVETTRITTVIRPSLR